MDRSIYFSGSIRTQQFSSNFKKATQTHVKLMTTSNRRQCYADVSPPPPPICPSPAHAVHLQKALGALYFFGESADKRQPKSLIRRHLEIICAADIAGGGGAPFVQQREKSLQPAFYSSNLMSPMLGSFDAGLSARQIQ